MNQITHSLYAMFLRRIQPLPALVLALLMACQSDDRGADAYGNFEAREMLVSAEATGKVMDLRVSEGQRLEAGEVVGYVDTLQLQLKKQQLQASIMAILSKAQDIPVQQQVYEEQKNNLLREQRRLENLLADGAAVPKQLDDIKGQIELLERQMRAHLATLRTTNQSLNREVAPIQAQIAQIDDQLAKSVITNPMRGRVLTTFVEPLELVTYGKPLYKLADMDELFLRAYVSGAQLPAVEVGQEVTVWIDKGANDRQALEGEITWIAEEGEFTPKAIQTKEARVDMVYAVKVKVTNDGRLKIGMPGELSLTNDSRSSAASTSTSNAASHAARH